MQCATVDYHIPGSVYFCELTQFRNFRNFFVDL